MANRTFRFAGPLAVPTSDTLAYTVPASSHGQTLINVTLRAVHVVNTTSGLLTFTLTIGGVAAGNALAYTFPIPANQMMPLPIYMPLEVSDTLHHQASGPGLTATYAGLESY